jgi:hypothetical protein
MKLPHVIWYNSPLPRWFKFHAQTFLFVICAPGPRLHLQHRRHEYRHVEQCYAFWFLALVGWIALRPAAWWLLLTPLAILPVYVVAGVLSVLQGGTWYHDNPLERDAREHAGEPVE